MTVLRPQCVCPMQGDRLPVRAATANLAFKL